MKLGIIGTGIFARDSHLPAIQANEGLQVGGVHNRTRAKAEEFARDHAHVPMDRVFDSAEALMQDKDIDAIDALVPVQLNPSIVEMAIKHNKPLAIEKPIAANLEGARKVVQLARSTDLPILVLENWVYHHSVAMMKEALPKIGNVVTFMYQSTGPYAQSKYHATAWRQKPQHVGGYLSDGGVHQLTLLTEVLGNVASVSAHASQIREVSGDIDTMNSLLTMESGAYGTFLYGSYMGATEKVQRFTIFGTNGTLEYEFKPASGSPAVVRLSEGPSANEALPTVTQTVPKDPVNGVVAEFGNFAGAVANKDKSLLKCKPEMAFHHFAIVVAAVESAKHQGQQVKVEKP